MSDEPIQLDTIVVQSREVQLRKVPGGPDRMFVQADGTGNVLVDFADGNNPWGDIRDLNEAQYEELRKEAFRKELADLEDIPTYAELYPPPGKGGGGASTTPNGNTQGRVNGEAPATGKSADDSNAEVESETPAEDDTGDKILDGLQLGLDVVGLIPVVGEIADLANAGISLARGDVAGAVLSLASAIPFVGWAGTAGKAARYSTKAAMDASAKATKEAAERAAKEAAKKEAQKRAKAEAARKRNSGGKGNGKRKKDPCLPLQDGVPGTGYRGGRHSSIRKGGKSYTPNRESHHMPADSAYTSINGKPVSSGAKPTIQMDKADHEQTASWGNSRESQAYKDRQRSLMKQGKRGYQMAMMMDIADVRAKFGDKYDGAIAQMLAWAKCKGYI
ncbi:hypothetical protein [Pseudomonas aeruginosa]|uniref:hypothetical protein n=1 Tax=Pseudomonas aeruginosa TaxID=287 RepID=UPI00255216B7|nr:hypothetical protein [Pseudomonas aeruginosa]MDK9821636.1 hypothetical protein [Pseudomonas aeruginosa]MDK9827854.1 hypothetical protein [Pseudomonas aeruginosa]HCI1801438.1 hypothetical protein [Pseudomonas aeruginosa]HCI2598859.1 hypothetical protein [Pseudomonas aeruginosa]HCK5608133.1 hypothetical protein [Pseudomonas aeruginosa]